LLCTGDKKRTRNLKATITGLEACETYVFAVGITGPLGVGPLSADPVFASTRFNVSAAPKNLKVSSDSHSEMIMNVHWQSSCPTIAEKIGYMVCGFL
jgi:hypothetical protein